MTEDLTQARFDAALAERGIAPDPEDRAAAFAIARFLDGCARRLRAADPWDDTTGPDGDA